jgi:hypothetical protein
VTGFPQGAAWIPVVVVVVVVGLTTVRLGAQVDISVTVRNEITTRMTTPDRSSPRRGGGSGPGS